ncbi:MAG: 2Fe-2S iron-sulfur cluster-binding protein [Janthinobacterium lividum]
MPKIFFVEHAGNRSEYEAATGVSVMQVATQNNVSGILAECGGAAACATCRVIVDEAWVHKVSAPGPVELSMLEPDEAFRLSCQILMGPELDGLVVHIPESQY